MRVRPETLGQPVLRVVSLLAAIWRFYTAIDYAIGPAMAAKIEPPISTERCETR